VEGGLLLRVAASLAAVLALAFVCGDLKARKDQAKSQP